MGCEVYANSNEIACKAGDGKVIAAFPDVCLSPPSPPAGPIPIPYPDTSFSKDMKNGSKTVKIKGKEIMLKDKSFYKTSPLGDEAATKTLGQGVINHTITGKTYFIMWSMDVKIEGMNVDRHCDLTTSNHASPMANEAAALVNLSSTAREKVKKDICPCCDGPIHSKGEMITEDQFYGLEDYQCKNGNTVSGLTDKQKQGRELMRKKCPGLFGEGDCKLYFITTPEEKDDIDKTWKSSKGKASRANIGAKADEKVSHRTARAAGGCPIGKGNLTKASDLSDECKKWEKTMGTYQAKRIQALREACQSS